MSKPIQIVVGGAGEFDPAIGATQYLNSELQGKEFYVERFGDGPLPYSLYTPLSNGGFSYPGGFEADAVYFVTVTGVIEATTNNSYTNGFNYSRVMNAMLNRIGFKQPTISEYAIVNSGNLTSNSGRYYDDFHALVRVKNIKEIQEDPGISDANFNAHLESLKRACIMRSLNGTFNVPEEIERVLLYDRFNNSNDQLIPNSDLFVGYEITTPVSDEFAVQVHSATLMFDGDVTFNMYLFKAGKKTPVLVREVSAIANEATVVNFSDVILNYISQNTKGSSFYFGYFQTDLGSVKAIREQYSSWNKQLCFGARSINTAKVVGETNFDRINIHYSLDPYGFNLEISTFRDHTNAIVKQAHLFDELQGLCMAKMVLESTIYSTNSNETERILKDQIVKAGLQMDLNGAIAAPDSPQIAGLKQQIDREVKRVKEAFYPKPKAKSVNLC